MQYSSTIDLILYGVCIQKLAPTITLVSLNTSQRQLNAMVI